MTEKAQLIHKKDYDGLWYWVCPICGKYMAPHNMDIKSESWKVMQCKGAASRHLMTHDSSLVLHGRKLAGTTKNNKIIIQKLFKDKNKILEDKVDKIVEETGVECRFCGKNYHTDRILEDGEVSSCCYCSRSGIYREGKLAI